MLERVVERRSGGSWMSGWKCSEEDGVTCVASYTNRVHTTSGYANARLRGQLSLSHPFWIHHFDLVGRQHIHIVQLAVLTPSSSYTRSMSHTVENVHPSNWRDLVASGYKICCAIWLPLHDSVFWPVSLPGKSSICRPFQPLEGRRRIPSREVT